MYSYLQTCMCIDLFYRRKYKLAVFFFFLRKGSILFYVTLLIFFPLVSGQITSGYLLFCMACKYDQLCHFIRCSPFQTPGETVSTNDFSSGKAVTHQSASVPVYVRARMLEKKTLPRFLSKLQCGSLKT